MWLRCPEEWQPLCHLEVGRRREERRGVVQDEAASWRGETSLPVPTGVAGRTRVLLFAQNVFPSRRGFRLKRAKCERQTRPRVYRTSHLGSANVRRARVQILWVLFSNTDNDPEPPPTRLPPRALGVLTVNRVRADFSGGSRGGFPCCAGGWRAFQKVWSARRVCCFREGTVP